MKKLRVALLGAVVAALVATSSAAAFTPSNQYYAKQWYLNQDNAFDAWDAPPPFAPPAVKVAIVDSGVDLAHPEIAARTGMSRRRCPQQRTHRPATMAAACPARHARAITPRTSSKAATLCPATRSSMYGIAATIPT